MMEILREIVDGRHHDPHSVLGPHIEGAHVLFRILRPWATAVTVVTANAHINCQHLAHGVWIAQVPAQAIPDYRLLVDYGSGAVPADDPYRFLPSLGELDLHLISEGRHEHLWEVLGAHVHNYDTELGPVRGTTFAVWAPNAAGVRVVGDFNAWDGASHPMRSLGASGVWELFIPFVDSGVHYKFEIQTKGGASIQKADPMARWSETSGSTASLVEHSTYSWQDSEWMRKRTSSDPHVGPMSVYEVHLGSWRKGLSYVDLAHQLTEYVREQGFTHVEFLPVMEHPYEPSWGYQVTSYYAPTSRFGTPDELRFLIDRLHQAEIGVILDWVPAHFPKDDWALAGFDGTTLYEHADPQRGEHPDWGTLIFDYGRNEVRNFLVANALYWLEEFHADGLRVDAVASMLYLDYSRESDGWSPNEFGGRENLDAVRFLQELNATVYRRVPGVVMIAEESTSWPGVTKRTEENGLGFGLKWNMGWMHDSLEYLQHESIHRQWHHNELTFSFVYQWSERFVLPLSHDEVVHGKGSLIRRIPGDTWQQMATLRAYLAYMWAHPGKKLLFMGNEWGQWAEWSQEHGLEWWLLDNRDHQGIQQCVADINHIYRRSAALWSLDHEPGAFSLLIGDAAQDNVLAFHREGIDGSSLISITNFSPTVRYDYGVPVPKNGRWDEALNTDATFYSGSGVGNLGGVEAADNFARVTLGPLATIWLTG